MTFEKDKKNSLVEDDAYYFELLTCAMIIRLYCRVEFDVKKNNKNNKLVGSDFRCAYNHVLSEKTSRL